MDLWKRNCGGGVTVIVCVHSSLMDSGYHVWISYFKIVFRSLFVFAGIEESSIRWISKTRREVVKLLYVDRAISGRWKREVFAAIANSRWLYLH